MAGAEPTTFRRFDTASGPSNQVKRGTWSAAEDARLRAAVNEYGFRWVLVAQKVQTRNGDQCAKRWNEKLDPKLDHSPWTPEEENQLLELVATYGRNWKFLATSFFESRPALAIKNRYSLLMRRLKREELEQGLSDHAFDSTHHGQESIPSSVPSGSGSVSPISTNQVDFPGSLLQSAQTSPSAASQQLPTFLPSSLDPAVITPRGQAPTTTDPNMQSQAPTTVSSNLDLLWQTNPLLEMDWEENLLATNGDSKTEPGNEVDGNTKAPLVECSIRCRRRRLKSMVNHLVDAAMKESADSATEDDHVTLTLQLKS